MSARHFHACDVHAPLAFMLLMGKGRSPCDSLTLDSSQGCHWCAALADNCADRGAHDRLLAAFGAPWA